MKFKRVFLLIIDSLGVGETLDAINFGDTGANTLGHVLEKEDLFIPNLKKIGFLDTLNMSDNNNVDAYYTIIKPASPSKDTLNAHYEMFGIQNTIPFKTFNQGFTFDILSAIEQITGRSIIGNICCNDHGRSFNGKLTCLGYIRYIQRTYDGSQPYRCYRTLPSC